VRAIPQHGKGRLVTIVEDTRVTRADTNVITASAGAPPAARGITGGVDTHADTHVAAALDPIGGLLGVRVFPATAAGYAAMLGWLRGFGTVTLVGVEGTGSYGAGLARHLASAGIRVVEAGRADRQDRHRQGKSDPGVSAPCEAIQARTLRDSCAAHGVLPLVMADADKPAAKTPSAPPQNPHKSGSSGLEPTRNPQTIRHYPAHGGTAARIDLLALTSHYAGRTGLARFEVRVV
jgi:hypothetical protein